MSARFFLLKRACGDTEETGGGHGCARGKREVVRRITTLITLIVLLLALMAAPAMATVVNIT